MRRIHNIKLKEDRPKAILAIKKAIGCNLSEAKEFVDKVLSVTEIQAKNLGYEWGNHLYEYDFGILSGQSYYWFETYIMPSAFDFDVECDDRPSNENIREPDEATKEALAWYETLTPEQKEMIELVNEWNRPKVYAAVC